MYELTGGQIDNIVRKIILNEVMGVKANGFDEMNKLCKQELSLSHSEQRTKIGFINNRKAV